jgi:hypothetical protein
MILAEDQPDPLLVAKMPRLAHVSASLEHEAANLLQVQTIRNGCLSKQRFMAGL